MCEKVLFWKRYYYFDIHFEIWWVPTKENPWRQGFHITNILHSLFLYESALRSFSLVTNCNERKAARSTFVQKKFVRKMLMKLATGADFINIFAQLFLWEQVEKLFMANGVWQMANRFGEWHINLANFTSPHMEEVWGRMLVKLNSKFIVYWRKLCIGNFLFGAQSLVKLTQGLKNCIRGWCYKEIYS